MISFARAHRLALVRVFLLAILICTAYIVALDTLGPGTVPRVMGIGFLAASMPWSIIQLPNTVALPVRIVGGIVIVAVGFAVNVTIVVALFWYLMQRVTRPSETWRKSMTPNNSLERP